MLLWVFVLRPVRGVLHAVELGTGNQAGEVLTLVTSACRPPRRPRRGGSLGLGRRTLADIGEGRGGIDEATDACICHGGETKNTVRFQEEANGKPAVIGTLYVQRWALGEPLPQRLTVTVEAVSA